MLISSKNLRLVMLIICLLLAAGGTFAANVTVTVEIDTDDGICDSHCSLREAIEAAAPGDTIIFDRRLRGGTIQLRDTLQIKKRLTIDGPNNRRITIRGNKTFRIFHINLEGPGRIATLEGLIISDGVAANGDGGGIYIEPTVATMNITNCAIVNNVAQRGGGIYMYGSGTLYIADTTIAGNAAIGDAGAGGIDVFRSTARIANSTISGNRSASAADGTGGIRFFESALWFITNCTVADNFSNGGGALSAGGLSAIRGSIPGFIYNTILARNAGINPDFYGALSGAKKSLVGITDARSGIIDGVEGNIVGSAIAPVDPLIGPLADNGGGLPTQALFFRSRAVNSGSDELATDPRGRPLINDQRGFQRVIGSAVDIGAYESGSQSLTMTSTITGRVIAGNGRGIAGARLILRNQNGETKFSITNPFGYYRFVDVTSGFAYSIECRKKSGNALTETFAAEESFEYFDFRPA